MKADAVEAGRKISNCLAFFASAIKCGEPFTETCRSEYDEAQAALRALLSAVEQKQWQPMASAPLSEDGKYPAYFIVWNGHHVGVAFRRVPYSDGDPEFCEEGGDFIEPPPTLWQPLPSPPTKQATHDR